MNKVKGQYLKLGEFLSKPLPESWFHDFMTANKRLLRRKLEKALKN